MKKGHITLAKGNRRTIEVEGLVHDCGLGVHKSLTTWYTKQQTTGYNITHLQSGLIVSTTVYKKDAIKLVEKLSCIDWNVDINKLSQLVTLKQKVDTVKEELGL